MIYIKLGPIGDKFVSRRYNINLPNSSYATQVPESLIRGPLVNFLLTGFIVQIKKLEYDNIRVDNRTFGNLPISTRGVYNDPTIEPVLDVLPEPPTTQANIGDRYIVFPTATGLWSGHKNCIMEYTENGWELIIPQRGWSVPVLSLGISTKYTGTYPSGRWSLVEPEPEEEFDLGLPTTEDGFSSGVTEEWVLAEIEKEAVIRSNDDRALQNQINQLRTLINNINTGGGSSGPVIASSVSIVDTGDYFVSGNVEGALQELAQKSSGGAGLTIIDVPSGSSKYTITWTPEMVAKHGNQPTSIMAMVAIPGQPLGTYRGIANNLIDYNFSGINITSIEVTLNNFAGRIIIR